MKDAFAKFGKMWMLALAPVLLLAVYFGTYPFADVLVSESMPLSHLAAAQRANIDLAASILDGAIIEPGQEFSFNKVVGPRTELRGYYFAPSYLGTENHRTVGGGICLVSSAVYKAALQAGLMIKERVPHSRTIKTVPPGFDATVWYGQADLKFQNTLSVPIQIVAEADTQILTVKFKARKPADFQLASIDRLVTRGASGDLVVECLRRSAQEETLVSRDHYVISQ